MGLFAGARIAPSAASSRAQALAKDTVSTLAGSGTGGFADGAAAEAQFDLPFGVAMSNGLEITLTR